MLHEPVIVGSERYPISDTESDRLTKVNGESRRDEVTGKRERNNYEDESVKELVWLVGWVTP